MARARLFVAVETPPGIRELITGVIEELREIRASVRWEPPEKLHATLKFLGQTAEENIPAINTILVSLTAGTAKPFPVQYTNPGVFPDRQRPRVIWIGIDDATGSMRGLHRSAEDAFSVMGFERETKSFRPHVTIGRIKERKSPELLLAKLETLTLDRNQGLIKELLLVRSYPEPAGSRYSVLERFPLGGTITDSGS